MRRGTLELPYSRGITGKGRFAETNPDRSEIYLGQGEREDGTHKCPNSSGGDLSTIRREIKEK